MLAARRFLLRLATFFRGRRAEAELAREIQAHLLLLEDRFRAEGLSVEEARFAARRAFGGVEQTKQRQRDARSFRLLDESWLDFKLGARMLVRYPGLTLVGGLGMAVAIAIATFGASAVLTLLDAALPLPEGDRLVAIQNWDARARTRERRLLHDFQDWQETLTSVRDVGAFRGAARNLIAPGGPPETVRVAETTSAAFRVARVAPLFGRHLLEHDERPGADPVVVLGHDLWRDRFASDPRILARTLQLGDAHYSIVGVMPEGFAFPINHRLWLPLQLQAAAYARRTGPQLFVFGRLAPGATLEQAQAELETFGRRTAAEFPETHAQLRPQVVPYTHMFLDLDEPENVLTLRLIQFLLVLLLVLVCVNVAILVYARTAARHAEIAVRTALGASRRRIVAQLFVEALVLSGVAAAAGLAVAALGLRQLDAALFLLLVHELPFWLDFSLSPATVAHAVAFALAAAAIVGIAPALKATGRHVQLRLQNLSAGGAASLQLGRTWTLLIVSQLAFAVALLPGVVFHAWGLLRYGFADPGPTASEFLTARLLPDPAADAGALESAPSRRERDAELLRRLRMEPSVADVTFARDVPGEEPTIWVEAEGVAMPSAAQQDASHFAVRAGRFGHEARANRVDVAFFDAFDVPLLTGRSFERQDTSAAASAVIVNRSFAERILGGANALGRRVRYVGRSGDARGEDVELERWYEIVGVVADFPANSTGLGLAPAKLYHAAAPGEFRPVRLALRLRWASPGGFAGRLREIAAAVDPNLQLRDIATMAEILRREQRVMRLVAGALALLTFSVVLLSAAGIYALVSFTVTQRRKEIGIRAALGADPRRILAGIFSRAFAQLGLGALLGMCVAAILERATHGDLLEGNAAVVLPAVAVFMTGIGLLAALGPARRGLRVDPTEALRVE